MIIQLDKDTDGLLRKKARSLTQEEIISGAASEIADRMSAELIKHDDGLALAAPQIGESVRIFIISKLMLEGHEKDLVFINPTITRRSKRTEVAEEGCLSIRGTYGQVKRSAKVTVEATDREGNKISMDATGLLARAIQHEVDHLNGVLFIDKATDVYVDTSRPQS